MENSEDEIGHLNKRINHLKIEERKYGIEWINRKKEEKRKVTNCPRYLKLNLEIVKNILSAS